MNNPSQNSQPQLFHCPTCGASLPAPDAPTVRCQYCGSSVLVPAEFLPKKQPEKTAPPFPTMVTMSAPPVVIQHSSRSSVGAIIGVIVMLAIMGSIALGVLAFTGVFATSSLVSSSVEEFTTQVVVASTKAPASTPIPSPTPTITPIPLASLAMQIGGKGNGPGQFDDPRSVAVDLDGNIYVANYQDGRVQKFDPSGKFLFLIQVEPAKNSVQIILDMALDYAGNLHVVRGGDIVLYSATDGQLVDTIPGNFPRTSYRHLAIDPANNLYTISESQVGDDLYKLSPGGKIVWKQESFIFNINQGDPANIESIAVDGLGTIFALDHYGKKVFKFDPQGRFTDQFGGPGEGEDKLSSPLGMAIDGKGRLFIADSRTLKIFDSNGSFIQAIQLANDLGVPFDLTFDLQGNLYIVTNQNFLLKYTLNLDE